MVGLESLDSMHLLLQLNYYLLIIVYAIIEDGIYYAFFDSLQTNRYYINLINSYPQKY